MESALNALKIFSGSIGSLVIDPAAMLLLFLAVIMGIIFGAIPGLTATLGVALPTTLTYGMSP